MTLRTGTVVFIGATVLCIAVCDVIALWRGGGRATISSVLTTAIYTPPYGAFIAAALGVLACHLLTGPVKP